MCWYHKLHTRTNCKKLTNGGESFSVDSFLSLPLERKGTHISLRLNEPQQFVNVVGIFKFDVDDNPQLWKRRNNYRFDRATKNVEEFFFANDRQLSTSVVRSTPVSTHHSKDERRVLMKFIEI